MAFCDFLFPQVQEQLGLRIEDANLFDATLPVPVRPEIAAFLKDGTALALANSTEKAKSEFIIAPILLELRRSVEPKFALFSGMEWEVDRDRGLNGYCDFILGRGPSQHILQAPLCGDRRSEKRLDSYRSRPMHCGHVCGFDLQ